MCSASTWHGNHECCLPVVVPVWQEFNEKNNLSLRFTYPLSSFLRCCRLWCRCLPNSSDMMLWAGMASKDQIVLDYHLLGGRCQLNELVVSSDDDEKNDEKNNDSLPTNCYSRFSLLLVGGCAVLMKQKRGKIYCYWHGRWVSLPAAPCRYFFRRRKML